MKKTLLAILAVLLCVSFADAQHVTVMKKKAGGECTNPSPGTVLGGNSTYNSSANSAIFTANNGVWTQNGHSVTWAETCETTTVSKVQVFAGIWDGGNCKAILYSGGSIVANGVTNAVSLAGWSADWHDLTFATAPTVTKGSTYIIVLTCDTQYAIDLSLNDAAGKIYYAETMYASPPSTMPTGSDISSGTLALRIVK